MLLQSFGRAASQLHSLDNVNNGSEGSDVGNYTGPIFFAIVFLGMGLFAVLASRKSNSKNKKKE